MTTKHVAEIKEVPNLPAKEFFVKMLTRDIDLHDAILDLLDNCVDGAIRTRSTEMAKEDSLEGYWTKINFDGKRFTIEDNCGGIPWNIAKDYAFCMGHREDVHTKPGTIGVVGIGMKRAIFKMGRECYVHSNHKDDAFLVSIPPTWFESKEWGVFDAEREKPSGRYGTIIEISELEEGVQLAFGKGSTFRDAFESMVAEAYSYIIEKGFNVKINGTDVKRKPIKLCFEDRDAPRKKGSLFRPYIYESKIKDIEVFIAVGYRSRMPTQEEQDNEVESSFRARESGWTIICNDRVVLSNDRTIKTGWGFGGIPNFHNQFSCIAGVVEFRSDNIANLPITTTKRGIDSSKDIYTLVRQRMQEGLKSFTKNTNRWKGFESELKEKFDKLEFLDLKELKKVAHKLPFANVHGDGLQKQFKPELPEKKRITTTRRICFEKKIADIEKVSQYLFDEIRTPEEVGETCFDRTLSAATK
jgi:hypothetical protein